MSEGEMKIDPSRAQALVSQLQSVTERVAAASKGSSRPVRLVAVSKLKPANDILALHQSATASQDHFGENYAQELREKADLLPRSIRWHFIGGLQSNHCKKLAKIPNLWCVSSIDSLKKAELLDKARGELLQQQQQSSDVAPANDENAPPSIEKLNVHVQVNTSGEDSKSGCQPGEETLALCRAIEESCPNLHLLGLMTIGAIARSRATTPETENEDFVALREERDRVATELGITDGRELELSMGMSEDFEGAIAMGSAEVRVGSTIFGQRPAKADAKITV